MVSYFFVKCTICNFRRHGFAIPNKYNSNVNLQVYEHISKPKNYNHKLFGYFEQSDVIIFHLTFNQAINNIDIKIVNAINSIPRD